MKENATATTPAIDSDRFATAPLHRAPRLRVKTWRTTLDYAVTSIICVPISDNRLVTCLYGYRVRKDGCTIGYEHLIPGPLREVVSI